MAKILVTGGLGHIGSKLIRELDHEIVILDNLSTQRYPSLFGIKHKFIEGDIRGSDLSFMKDIDVVIHLAAMTDPADSVDKRDEYFSVNVDGTKRIAETCIEYGCKMIFPSTTSINNDAPSNNYAESKLVAEKMLNGMDFPYAVLRFGTIFGISVGMRFSTAVNKFTWQALHGQPITVWKSALKQIRPYLDINDCMDVIRRVIDEDMFQQETKNALTGNYTVKKVTDIIKELIPTAEIEYVDSPVMNESVYELTSDFTGLKGDLRERIQETIDLFHGA